jgi:DNA repair protein RecN (Recombination protein N)
VSAVGRAAAALEAPSGEPQAGRLLELSVADLALIERLRLPLEPGLNVFTGETGAGKSLLIDALGLVLGARADTTLVRHGSSAARVEALFDRLPEPLIAVREVAAEGRSTARLDDEAVTAARLAETTGPLVEIHGQSDQGRLLDERWQRDLLDAAGGHDRLRAAMTGAVERWRDNRRAMAELDADPREVSRRVELLEHEAGEIESARLRPGEATEIQVRLDASRHGEAIARGAAALAEALHAEERGARDTLAAAVREARAITRLDQRFEGVAERLASLEAETDDVATVARELAEAIDHDPAELARLEERLSTIYGLERRYGDDEAAVIAHAEAAREEADRLRGLDAERERRGAEDGRLLGEVADAARRLSAARRSVAAELAAAVDAALVELGFPSDVFAIVTGRRPADADEPAVEIDGDAVAFDSTGVDAVVFELAPNTGEPARPLSRIASGGELSRVALAIREILAAADETPTLVFDEIDAGIGGRSADPVGHSLWQLARRHQVLCVTHLPQIAAWADAHFHIAKRERGGRTVTEVSRLDDDGRLEELALMVGGQRGAGGATASARELLDRVAAARREGQAVPAG